MIFAAILLDLVAVLFGAQLREWALALPLVRDAPAALPWLVAENGSVVGATQPGVVTTISLEAALGPPAPTA